MSKNNPPRNVVAVVVPPDGDQGDPAPNLASSLKGLERALVSRPGKHTILVVTPDKASRETSEASSRLKIIWQNHPGKQAQRTLAGYRLALQLKPDLILSAPTSWEPPPQELHSLLDRYETGARVVTGCRPLISWNAVPANEQGSDACSHQCTHKLKALSDRLNRRWARISSGSKCNDPASPIRLYDSGSLQTLLSNLKTDGTPPEAKLPYLERKAGFSVKEVAISHWTL